MSIKSPFFSLLDKISKYGNANYNSKSEIKANIISNQILAFLIFNLFMVGIISIIYLIIMLLNNEKSISVYFFSYSFLEISIILINAFIFIIRNKFGNQSKRVLYDNIALYSGMIYITLLSFLK